MTPNTARCFKLDYTKMRWILHDTADVYFTCLCCYPLFDGHNVGMPERSIFGSRPMHLALQKEGALGTKWLSTWHRIGSVLPGHGQV